MAEINYFTLKRKKNSSFFFFFKSNNISKKLKLKYLNS